jgi:A/G-specific adenine glycosylase
MTAAAFSASVLGLELRDLPWRRTRDPWAVLVSELMLQQTQVARVAERWPAWLAAYPDPTACAQAPTADIIRSWSGLGYNRRALNLHRAAQLMVEVHGGRVPNTLDELLALPGIGPYTARAVLAFAYEVPVGVLDTNAGRVLARGVAGRPLGWREAQTLADGLVPAGQAWRWNQAVLDLGARWCRARGPECEACPARSACAWAGAGRPPPDPAQGTAAASAGQSTFAGSDRQGRGRLLRHLGTHGPAPAGQLAAVAGWPEDGARALRVAAGLVGEGLARWTPEGHLALPQ